MQSDVREAHRLAHSSIWSDFGFFLGVAHIVFVGVASDIERRDNVYELQEDVSTMNSARIRSAALRRGVTSLYHFSPFANLESILANGLVSRRILEDHRAAYVYTDDWRNDGQPDAVSFSIHDINRSMFSQKLRLSSCAWAIFEVDASVLWTHPCRFCWVNAASSTIVNHRGRIDGPWAFEEMFADRAVSASDARSSRDVFDTPENMPTRNDAEVQVLAPIAPEAIRDVSVASESCRAAAEAAMNAVGRVLPVVVVPEVFARR